MSAATFRCCRSAVMTIICAVISVTSGTAHSEEFEEELDLATLSVDEACQLWSDELGVSDERPGFAPAPILEWWKDHGCQTRPRELDVCQLASDRYFLTPKHPGLAPEEVVRWFSRRGCRTAAKIQDPCQALSDQFAMSNQSSGCASAAERDFFKDRQCTTKPASPFGCRFADEVLDFQYWKFDFVLRPDLLAELQRRRLWCLVDRVESILLKAEERNPDFLIEIIPKDGVQIAADGEVITLFAASSEGVSSIEVARKAVFPASGVEVFGILADPADGFRLLAGADSIAFEESSSCAALQRDRSVLVKKPSNVRFAR